MSGARTLSAEPARSVARTATPTTPASTFGPSRRSWGAHLPQSQPLGEGLDRPLPSRIFSGTSRAARAEGGSGATSSGRTAYAGPPERRASHKTLTHVLQIQSALRGAAPGPLTTHVLEPART